jgi:hypothetical protein
MAERRVAVEKFWGTSIITIDTNRLIMPAYSCQTLWYDQAHGTSLPSPTSLPMTPRLPVLQPCSTPTTASLSGTSPTSRALHSSAASKAMERASGTWPACPKMSRQGTGSSRREWPRARLTGAYVSGTSKRGRGMCVTRRRGSFRDVR